MKGIIEYRVKDNEGITRNMCKSYKGFFRYLVTLCRVRMAAPELIIDHRYTKPTQPTQPPVVSIKTPVIAPVEDEGKLQVGLSKEKAQELFEAHFGESRETRTRQQWKRLVDVYGMETVAGVEKMTIKEIRAKCKNGIPERITAPSVIMEKRI